MQVVVCAPDVCQEFELDLFSAQCAHTSVEFGLLLAGRLSMEQFVQGLERTLAVFPHAAGRLCRRDGKVVLVGNNAGVLASHCVKDELAPSFALPLPDDLFDVVCDYAPAEGEPAEGTLLKLRLTDFTDRQALCVSFSHGIMDAASAGMFLATIAANCRGESLDVNVHFDRSSLPSTPGPGEPPLAERDAAPKAWQAMHTPFEMPEMHEPVPMAVISHPLSQEECAALKSRMAAAADGAAISTNDALLTELLLSFGYKEERVTWHLVMNVRGVLGLEGLWGNAVMTQAFSLPNSEAAAGELRQQLSTIDKDYVTWKFGQSTAARARLSNFELRFNSFVKALDVNKLKFGPGGAAEAVSVGLPMWRAHAAMFGRARVASCIVTSFADGVLMSVLCTRSHAEAMVKENGFSGTIFNIP